MDREFTFPRFVGCSFDGPIVLDRCVVGRLEFIECSLDSLTGRDMRVSGDVVLDSSDLRRLDVTGSTIQGRLSVKNCRVSGDGFGTPAFRADLVTMSSFDGDGLRVNAT
ncbi:MAG: hypothetical protein ACFCVG_00960 [Kineosporiaceae bacterium]